MSTNLCNHVLFMVEKQQSEKKNHNNNKKKFNFNSCLRVYVLDVACFVDGLSVYFAYRLRLKRDRICKDLSVC